MLKKYHSLLSPIKIGDIVLKNRLIASSSRPHFHQGPEVYPTQAMITHYANKAKNGAAIVTCSVGNPVDIVETRSRGYIKYRILGSNATTVPGGDYLEVYLSQMTEAIHFYGAKASAAIRANVPRQYDVSTGIPSLSVYGDERKPMTGKEIPSEMLDEIADGYALQAALMKDLGFDMLLLHMAYRG